MATGNYERSGKLPSDSFDSEGEYIQPRGINDRERAVGGAALARIDMDPTVELTDEHALYEEISQRVITEAQRRRASDVQGYIDQYSRNLRYCRDEFIPYLKEKYDYEGTLPFSSIQNSCLKSPDNFPRTIERWFSGSLQLIRRLQSSGDTCINDDVSQFLIRTHASLLNELDVIDGLSYNKENPPLNHSDLRAIRAAYNDGTLKAFSGKDGWDSAIMRYATKHFLPLYKGNITEEDINEAARYTTSSVGAYNQKTNQHLASDWLSKVGVAFAYLDDVDGLRRQGVTNVYAVARYNGPATHAEFIEEYGCYGVSRGVVNRVFNRTPLSPREQLDNILEERTAVSNILQEAGHEIDVETLTYMAMHRPFDAQDKVSKFLERYTPLLDAYRWMPDLEDWMIARSVMRYPDNPERGVRFYIKLMRKGYFTSSVRTIETKGWGNSPQEFNIKDFTAAIARMSEEDVPLSSAAIALLDKLSVDDAAAVKVIFCLEPFLDLDEREIATRIGVEDLEEYVMTKVLPRLRSDS